MTMKLADAGVNVATSACDGVRIHVGFYFPLTSGQEQWAKSS